MSEEPDDVPSDGVELLNGLTGFLYKWTDGDQADEPNEKFTYDPWSTLHILEMLLFSSDRLVGKIKKVRQSEKVNVRDRSQI
jgi:hypothetical protein